MKKLIEFQDEKHKDVIEIIAQYRAENNTTFSEAVRRIILSTSNGNCPCPEPEPDRIDTIERKLEIVIAASKSFKKFMEEIGHRTTDASQDEE